MSSCLSDNFTEKAVQFFRLIFSRETDSHILGESGYGPRLLFLLNPVVKLICNPVWVIQDYTCFPFGNKLCCNVVSWAYCEDGAAGSDVLEEFPVI